MSTLRTARRRPPLRQDRRPAAAPGPASPAVAALRRGRQAITAMESDLDEILVWVVDPSTGLDVRVVDRLAARNREAGEALGGIAAVDIPGITSHAIF